MENDWTRNGNELLRSWKSSRSESLSEKTCQSMPHILSMGKIQIAHSINNYSNRINTRSGKHEQRSNMIKQMRAYVNKWSSLSVHSSILLA